MTAKDSNGNDWFRLSVNGTASVVEKIEVRVAERKARGILTPEEITRVSQMKLRTFAGDRIASEAFRQCCITWEADRPVPLTSHRPIVGGLIVAAKKGLRRTLRFLNEPHLARQRDFNWNLLLVLRDLLERIERER